jgi:glycosyltransferase involved in cell wall biosynthesis
MLSSITPVILTHNEGPNIERTLAKLGWASDIVVVDSGSSDETLAILRADRRVRLFYRAFDTHHAQWQFATQETGIATPWILRLDADYQVSQKLVDEISRLDPRGAENAYRVAFDYAIYSRKLISSLYPSKTILLRQGFYSVLDAGHTEAWEVEGSVGVMNGRIVHDDWKPMSSWIPAQVRYMKREIERSGAGRMRLRDWVRQHPPLMPIAVFLYCMFWKGLVLNGTAGIYYSLQRAVAEAIFSLLYLEQRLQSRPRPSNVRNPNNHESVAATRGDMDRSG